AVLAGRGRKGAVLHRAGSAVGGGPERPALTEAKRVAPPPAKPVGGRIRCADLIAGDVGDAAEMKAEPQPSLRWIGDQNTGMVFMSQRGPGNPLHLTLAGQLNKPHPFVVDPDVPRLVLNDGKHSRVGKTAYGDEAVILQVADVAKRRDPDSPTIILKKRVGVKSVEFAVRFAAAGAGNCNLPVTPSLQAAKSAEPHASVPVCENRPDDLIRQPLSQTKRGDGKVAKAVETVIGSYPNIAF